MKKLFHITLFIAICTIFYSCQTVSQFQFQYLTPAKISFPSDIRKVGVINNAPTFSEKKPQYICKDSLNPRTGVWLHSYLLSGFPTIATNALAETLADENYFDKVTISDSLIRDVNQEGPLTGEEVTQLAEDLDADMLISLEYLPIKITHRLTPTEGVLRGTTDATVYPQIKLYTPHRKSALTTIQVVDSIRWESYYLTYEDGQREFPPDLMVLEESSLFAGEISASYLIPTWTNTTRFFYPGGSAEMRDAAYFAHNNEWDKALGLWEKAYNQTTGRKQGRAASNLSLCYEMNNDLQKAEEWNKVALGIFEKVDKMTPEMQKKPTEAGNDYTRTLLNQFNLQKRGNEFSALKLQMDRFNEEKSVE